MQDHCRLSGVRDLSLLDGGSGQVMHVHSMAGSLRLLLTDLKSVCRESRQEDIAKIAELRRIVQEQANSNTIAENNLQQMRAELLLREHNFNKTFQGGGGLQALAVDKAINAQKGVVEWMIKPKARSKQIAGRRTLG